MFLPYLATSKTIQTLVLKSSPYSPLVGTVSIFHCFKSDVMATVHLLTRNLSFNPVLCTLPPSNLYIPSLVFSVQINTVQFSKNYILLNFHLENSNHLIFLKVSLRYGTDNLFLEMVQSTIWCLKPKFRSQTALEDNSLKSLQELFFIF